MAAIAALIWVLPVVTAGATTTTVLGDTSCGYGGTTQFTESTVMRWAQTTGTGLHGTTFEAYANDENSTLLGVSGATADTTSPQHSSNVSFGDTTQHDGIALTGSEQPRPYYPALYITPVSGPGSWTTPGDATPQEPGDWQQGSSPVDTTVNDIFGTWVVGSQTINPSAAPGQVGTLTSTLSTSTNTTSLPVGGGTTHAITSGDSLVLSQSGKTQTFKAFGNTTSGATSIPVVGQKANFAYSSGTTVTDTTAQTGDYARQSSLPAKNDWNLGTFNPTGATGTNADQPVGRSFSTMGDEGYGTEFRWNADQLKDYQNQPLTTGQWYKVQVVEHDGDQNKGGDSGEFCTLIKIPGAPAIHTDPTGGNSITGGNVDGHVKQWTGTHIKDTAFLPANNGFGNVTGSVQFNLYFDANHAPNPTGSCPTAGSAPPGTKVFTDTQTLDGNDPSVATSASYNTANTGYGTYYWQDVFTPGGSNASSYDGVTEACGTQTDQMVNARVRLTPHTAVNVVGATHTLHAIAETSTDGSSWTAQPLETIDTSLTSPTNASYNGASASAMPPGSCQTGSMQPALPDGTTSYCNVTFTDSHVEDVFITATSNITETAVTGGVNGDDSITESTDNSASCQSDNASGATCEAVKHFINPKTTLTVADTLKGLGSGANGTIHYTAYTSLTDCQGTTTNSGTTYDLTPNNNTVSGDAAPTSKTVDVAPGVTVYFTATYSGNEGNLTTSCTAEQASSS